MIDWERTERETGFGEEYFEKYPGSGKKVCAICDECGKERWILFFSYCNLCRSCSKKGQIPWNKKNKIILKCDNCGKELKRLLSNIYTYNFCDRKCKSEWQSKNTGGKNHPQYKDRVLLKCDNCGKELARSPCFVNNHNFCNNQCHGEWKSKNQCGENNGNWKDGISSERELFYSSKKYKQWRISIFKRDNYTCQECGDSSGGNLNAHHILPYRDWRDEQYSLNIMNGITLCENCHKETIWHEYEFFNKYFDIANGIINKIN